MATSMGATQKLGNKDHSSIERALHSYKHINNERALGKPLRMARKGNDTRNLQIHQQRVFSKRAAYKHPCHYVETAVIAALATQCNAISSKHAPVRTSQARLPLQRARPVHILSLHPGCLEQSAPGWRECSGDFACKYAKNNSC